MNSKKKKSCFVITGFEFHLREEEVMEDDDDLFIKKDLRKRKEKKRMHKRRQKIWRTAQEKTSKR